MYSIFLRVCVLCLFTSAVFCIHLVHSLEYYFSKSIQVVYVCLRFTLIGTRARLIWWHTTKRRHEQNVCGCKVISDGAVVNRFGGGNGLE